jgi:ABC-type sugar transport system ATPase subunit
MRSECLSVVNLTTNDPVEQNLEYVSFELFQNEILGITGLSDSGITTLAKVLTGTRMISSGKILLNGKPLTYKTPVKAKEQGIFSVSDKSTLIPFMNVFDNVCILQKYDKSHFFINKKEKSERLLDLLNKYDLFFDSKINIAHLAYLEKIKIEIIKALYHHAKVLVIEDLGAGLSISERTLLYDFLRKISKEGLSIIAISANMDHILALSQRIMIMRSGMICHTCNAFDTGFEDLRRFVYLPNPGKLDQNEKLKERLLSVKNLHKEGMDKAVTFEIYTGATIGIQGQNPEKLSAFFSAFCQRGRCKGTSLVTNESYPHTLWKKKHSNEIYYLGSRFWEDNVFNNLTIAENLLLRTYYRFKETVLDKKVLVLSLKDFCKRRNLDYGLLCRLPSAADTGLTNQIALLSALFYPPRILCLNRAFFTLDERNRQYLIKCIGELKKCGTAILCGECDEQFLKSISDMVIKL